MANIDIAHLRAAIVYPPAPHIDIAHLAVRASSDTARHYVWWGNAWRPALAWTWYAGKWVA